MCGEDIWMSPKPGVRVRDMGGVSIGTKKLSEVIERVMRRRGVEGVAVVNDDESLALGIVRVSEGGRGGSAGRGVVGGGAAGIVGLRMWRRGLYNSTNKNQRSKLGCNARTKIRLD